VRHADLFDDLHAARNRSVPVLRTIRRKYSKSIASLPAREVLEIAGRLLETRDSSLRFVAYELVHYHPSTRQSLRKTTIERLGRGMQSWGEVDAFGYYITGPAWSEGNLQTPRFSPGPLRSIGGGGAPPW
jgi:hypothetical protein